MCTRRLVVLATVTSFCLLSLGACSSSRTGTNFCRVLQKELPAIAMSMTTPSEVSAMVSRYQKLLDVAPLAIEDDLKILTNLLEKSAKVDASDPESVQEIADLAYAVNKSALAVSAWTKDTCAVDISLGVNIDPPRVAPPTTVAPTTTAPLDTTTTSVIQAPEVSTTTP
ncbi:MAG: hypothetical protein EXQ63_05480 [Ilumatobacteraceae bacterium]|nr:hypothetical protein [Ilumatobacteraceae bacterium]